MNAITCPKCKLTFDPDEALFICFEDADGDDAEIRIECPGNECNQRFYSFVKPVWVAINVKMLYPWRNKTENSQPK